MLMNVVLNYHGRFDSFILSRMQEGENILWNEILRETEKLKIMGSGMLKKLRQFILSRDDT